MRPVNSKLFLYFNFFHFFVSFLIFPVVVLTQHHGWLIGIVAYLGLIGVVSFLADKFSKKISSFLLTPLLTIITIYAFQLTFGVFTTVLIWLIISAIFAGLSYWSYHLHLNTIQKHRKGIPVDFHFPTTTPNNIQEKQQVDYFDPDAFEITFLETTIVPLSLEYTVQGKSYQQSFDYYWKVAPWENTETIPPSSNYTQGLSGRTFSLQYNPNNPEELLEIIPQNYLSTFEAFTKSHFKKALISNLIQFIFLLSVAAAFHYYG